MYKLQKCFFLEVVVTWLYKLQKCLLRNSCYLVIRNELQNIKKILTEQQKDRLIEENQILFTCFENFCSVLIILIIHSNLQINS